MSKIAPWGPYRDTDKISTLGGVGSNDAGDPLRDILDLRGDPYGQNFDPRGVRSNHAGDPVGAILDLRRKF